jgi:hypothetical protein
MPHCKAKPTALAEAHATGYILHRRRRRPAGRLFATESDLHRISTGVRFARHHPRRRLADLAFADRFHHRPGAGHRKTGHLRRPRILPPDLLEVVRVYQSGRVNDDVIDKLEQNSPLGRCWLPACAMSTPRAKS